MLFICKNDQKRYAQSMGQLSPVFRRNRFVKFTSKIFILHELGSNNEGIKPKYAQIGTLLIIINSERKGTFLERKSFHKWNKVQAEPYAPPRWCQNCHSDPHPLNKQQFYSYYNKLSIEMEKMSSNYLAMLIGIGFLL